MADHQKLLQLFINTRTRSEWITSFLETEDFVVQPVIDVSPPKWHLGHTTWFFEEFILKTFNNYSTFNDRYSFIFNSYYESLGKKVARADRGNLTRPSVAEVMDYRKHVSANMVRFLKDPENFPDKLLKILELGIHHEKQHQELLMTDIKFILGHNPLFPVFNIQINENPIQDFQREWIRMEAGIYHIGQQPSEEFAFDNERGRHKVYLEEFEISNRLVTNGEFLEFIEDNGYKEVSYWHAEAWEWIRENQITNPLYWHQKEGVWHQYTLRGLGKLDPRAPVSHVSYYEAFAFAEWMQMRLPTEFEWEAAQENFQWGSRWEWTESAYLPYPGYAKEKGALGEYNGKFMVNQKVMRGSSIASSPKHIRPTYRNFFHPHLRWQFSGFRLATKQEL